MLLMKSRLLLFGILFISFFNAISADPPAYIREKDGVIVFTEPLTIGQPNAVKLEVVSDNIIRVIALPGKDILPIQSLITVYVKKQALNWNIVPTKERITLTTKALTAIVDIKTGGVSFFDSNGKKILSEKPASGRSFKPAVFDGKRY